MSRLHNVLVMAKHPRFCSLCAYNCVGVQVTLGHVVDRKMREMGYIRKPAVNELKNRRSLRDRVAAEGAPEVGLDGATECPLIIRWP